MEMGNRRCHSLGFNEISGLISMGVERRRRETRRRRGLRLKGIRVKDFNCKF